MPAELPLYYLEKLALKKMVDNEPREVMNNDLNLLLTTISNREMMKHKYKIPLTCHSDNRFLCPVESTIKQCNLVTNLNDVIYNIYYIVWWHAISAAFDVSEFILPKPLVRIIDLYLFDDYIGDGEGPIDSQILRLSFAFYNKIIDGAQLFDNDNPRVSSISKFYATRYFDERGIKSVWKKRTMRCKNQDFKAQYPRLHDILNGCPNYKCEKCTLEYYCEPKTETHQGEQSDIWYLHFPWGLPPSGIAV